jgi:hypothetical protein
MAAAALARAGIQVIWLDCTEGEVGLCAATLQSGEFWMHVARWKPANTTGETLGFTVPGNESGGLAGVYVPMLQDMAMRFQLDEAPILGAALTHEIGHLLGASHAPTGIMRSQFRRTEIVEMAQGGLGFSDSQAAEIRARLAR